MKQKQYKYAVLKYRPSYWLDEQVNIGLLFLFPEDSKVVFLHPTQLKRIHSLFPKSNIPQIKSYLTAFNSRAGQLSKKNLFLESSREEILNSEFLISDANAFFFSQFKTGIYQSSTDNVLEYYRTSYFSIYENTKKENQRDENWIANQFNSYIKKRAAEKLHLFQRDIDLKNKSAHATFNHAWQNGTLNLIRPLGFDLQTPEGILEKSNLWLGKITCLKSEIDKGEYRIDFLVSEPNSQNIELKDSFDNALDVLNKIDVNKKIVYVSDLTDYIEDALESVKSE